MGRNASRSRALARPGSAYRVYVGTFGTRREAEDADAQHRVAQRQIKAGDLPAAVDQKLSTRSARLAMCLTRGWARSPTSSRSVTLR